MDVQLEQIIGLLGDIKELNEKILKGINELYEEVEAALNNHSLK